MSKRSADPLVLEYERRGDRDHCQGRPSQYEALKAAGCLYAEDYRLGYRLEKTVTERILGIAPGSLDSGRDSGE